MNEYKNSYNHSFNKNSTNADYSALTGKIEKNSKAPKVKVKDGVRATNYNKIFYDSCT